MIPLKLRLKNFMCYRDVPDPLALEGIHVACICGDNGHGKSALLDAMTWALWGKAREEESMTLSTSVNRTWKWSWNSPTVRMFTE